LYKNNSNLCLSSLKRSAAIGILTCYKYWFDVRRLQTLHISIMSSETTWAVGIKLFRNDVLKVLHKYSMFVLKKKKTKQYKKLYFSLKLQCQLEPNLTWILLGNPLYMYNLHSASNQATRDKLLNTFSII
jgi:hypothetical protein